MDNRPVFRVTLRSEASSRPAGRRLAGLLKVALRAFHFRAVRMEELPAGGERDNAATAAEREDKP